MQSSLRHFHRRLFLFLLLFSFTLIFVHYRYPNNQRKLFKKLPSKLRKYDNIEEDPLCENWLRSNEPTITSLILDTDIIKSIPNGNCHKVAGNSKSIKIGVPLDSKAALSWSSDKFDIVYWENSNKTDYYKFYDDVTRITPKFQFYQRSKWLIPVDSNLFDEYYRRSEFIDSLSLYINRGDQRQIISPVYGTRVLAKLRDILVSYGMFSFLVGGTLLGWYREATIIPHTGDIDIAVFIHEYNRDFLEFIKSNESGFKLNRKLGMENDSYEFTVYPKNYHRMYIDIFFMYEDRETGNSWVGGMDSRGNKYRYDYPKYNPYCAADLKGHIFWVTCTPVQMLEIEYGPKWYEDHPTRRFVWNKSHKNVRPNGRWPEEILKEIHSVY